MGGKWGYIDKKAAYVINPQFEDAAEFNEGVAVVKNNGKWGLIDEKGAYLIQPQFDGVCLEERSCGTVI